MSLFTNGSSSLVCDQKSDCCSEPFTARIHCFRALSAVNAFLKGHGREYSAWISYAEFPKTVEPLCRGYASSGTNLGISATTLSPTSCAGQLAGLRSKKESGRRNNGKKECPREKSATFSASSEHSAPQNSRVRGVLRNDMKDMRHA